MRTPIALDLTLYDRGYQFDWYDLVVLTVENMNEAIYALHVITQDEYYKNGRVCHPLTESEVREHLSQHRASSAVGSCSVSTCRSRPRETGWLALRIFDYRGKT